MATRRAKKPEPPPLFDFPCTTTWYESSVLPPPQEAWCLLWTVDEDNEDSVYIARWDGKLKVWLTADNTAPEAIEHGQRYSPIFTPSGQLWLRE